MIRISLLGAAALIAASAPLSVAPAQTPALNAARAAGTVGERYDGYLGFTPQASAAVRSQVGAVNIRRRSLYTNLASTKRVSPQEVGIAAGCQLLARVAVGQLYMFADGEWRRRGPSEAAPRPDYCG
jgi:uncharacterized protein YdbL (DUF1318 family)